MTRILYPLSVDLSGKPVLVVGGGTIAARKMTELIHCGAVVTVIAIEIVPAIRRLDSVIQVIERKFKAEDIKNYYLVFACTNRSEVNENISELCHQKNILCNIANNSESGSFHVPGVVRHGDVTLTVSTGGIAPGLTRHLKRELSHFLGDEIVQFTALLGQFRKALKLGDHSTNSAKILETLPYRTLLTELKSHGAQKLTDYFEKILLTGQLEYENISNNNASVSPKTVYLVGAGPGNPKLLTVLAAEIISLAEVIIYDRLIPEQTLQLSHPSCLLIAAGKRGHFESTRQADIEALLVSHALRGKRVVRLKGGDPFIFGRGWEEVIALEANAIPWAVIPGLSSTTAGPTWAGIPLTHRGVARSYAVMSGMAYSETNTEIPKADTLVLLMGLHRLGEIIPTFLKKGFSPQTPVAAIQNATMADQRICRSTLKNLIEDTTKLGFDSPTLIIVGEVVNLGIRR